MLQNSVYMKENYKLLQSIIHSFLKGVASDTLSFDFNFAKQFSEKTYFYI